MKHIYQKLENQVIKTIKMNFYKIIVMGVVVKEVMVIVVYYNYGSTTFP
jgi:hypothetical protein